MNDLEHPIVKLKNITKLFTYGRKSLYALHNISLEIKTGTTLGIVGESGCGKSTLGRVILKLEEATSGEVYFQGGLLKELTSKQMQPLRRQMQMIFQDPYSSLNPRFTIEQVIGEGIDIHKLADKAVKKELIAKLICDVGLSPQMLQRYPHEFSGGQKQRIGIARALAVDPALLVCDEPLSALDTCTQKQVMELFLHLKKERNLTYVFISHDLHAVRTISDTVAVMYLGHIVEFASAKDLFNSPLHPYTQGLIDAIPIADPLIEKSRKRLMIYGEPPSPLDPPKGCPFHTRCPKATAMCKEVLPELCQKEEGRFVACHMV